MTMTEHNYAGCEREFVSRATGTPAATRLARTRRTLRFGPGLSGNTTHSAAVRLV